MQRLRLFLYGHGIYQREFAQALARHGVASSEAAISRILRGSRRPATGWREAATAAAAELVGRPVTFDELFEEES